MNRQIKFRGLRKDVKGWVYGYYFHHLDGQIDQHIIIDPKGFENYVNPETVGQFTGLKDKNGKDIYEGDIESTGGECEWNADSASFVWNWPNIETVGMEGEKQWCEVVSNIHEQ
jgi:uncharacterized phage protein (TIGR01671 family)